MTKLAEGVFAQDVLGAQVSSYSLVSAASTNATLVAAGPRRLFSLLASNSNAGTRFIKLYNKATSPTVGTDQPVLIFPIPPLSFTNVQIDAGIQFPLGLGFCLTVAGVYTDTAAVAVNDIRVVLNYL